MDNRPTSPHVNQYRWQITNTLSIFHRMSGMANYGGTFLLVAWLWAAAYAPEYYDQLYSCIASPIGMAVMIGWTASLYYHMCNGVRHLFWDIGKGYALSTVTLSGWTVLLVSLSATAATWGYVLSEGVGA